MNSKKAKDLKKLFLRKPEECLLLVRKHYGKQTEKMEINSLLRNFKRLWKRGLIPESLFKKEKEN